MIDETTTEQAPAPAAAPEPAPAPAPAPAPEPAHAKPEPNPPQARWDEVIAQKNAAAEAAKAAKEAAEQALSEAEAARKEAAKWKARHERDLAYVDYRDRPSLQDEAVRGFVESQYDAYRAAEGDGASGFAAWLRDVAPANPVLAPHFTPPTIVQAPAPAKGKPADPSAGVTGPTPPAVTFERSQAEIRDLRSRGVYNTSKAAEDFRAALDAGEIVDTPQNRALLRALEGR